MSLFPLSMAPFEKYMLADDRPSHPMTFSCQLQFSGRLQRAAFETALKTVLQRHPLLTAIVKRNRWVQLDQARDQLRWTEAEEEQKSSRSIAIDITTAPGLQVDVVNSKHGATVHCLLHHCTTDGAGAEQVVLDLLAAYANAVRGEGEQVSLADLDPQLLRRRDRCGMSRWQLLKMAKKQLVGLKGVRQFFSRTPQPLLPHEVATEQAAISAARSHRFDAKQSVGLRDAAAKLGVTPNDLLIRDIFLALGKWRTIHDIGESEDWLRLSIPISLRSPATMQMPAANQVSMIFLDRQASDFADADELLRGVHEEMKLIKKNRLEFTFLLSLRMLSAIPGAIRRSTAVDQCAATCLVSNVGPLLERSPLPRTEGKIVVGDACLESIEIGAPNRPYQSVAFLLSVYAGRMCINMQYDSRVLSDDQSAELLNICVEQVQQSIASLH